MLGLFKIKTLANQHHISNQWLLLTLLLFVGYQPFIHGGVKKEITNKHAIDEHTGNKIERDTPLDWLENNAIQFEKYDAICRYRAQTINIGMPQKPIEVTKIILFFRTIRNTNEQSVLFNALVNHLYRLQLF